MDVMKKQLLSKLKNTEVMKLLTEHKEFFILADKMIA